MCDRIPPEGARLESVFRESCRVQFLFILIPGLEAYANRGVCFESVRFLVSPRDNSGLEAG